MPLKDKISTLFAAGDDRSRVVVKNIVESFLIKGISIVTSFVLVPLTLGYVSSEIYGVWLVISSVLYWMSYMDIGFTLGLKNRLAECLASGDLRKGRSLVSTTYFLMIAIFVPVGLLIVFAAPFIDWCGLFNVNREYSSDIVRTVQILSVFMSLQMIANVFVSVVSAYQKVALSNLFVVVGQIFSLLIIWLMSRTLAPSLVNLSFAYSMMPVVVVFVASVIFFLGSMKQVAPSWRTVDMSYVKDLGGLGVKFFIIQMQMIVLYQSTNFLISHVAGPESVTQYNIAYKLLNVLVMVYAIVLNPLWPAFTDAYTKGDFQWMKKIYGNMTRIFGLLAAALVLVVALSPFIYRLWISDMVDIPMLLTASIALYSLIQCWMNFQVTLINGTGMIALQTYVVLAGLVLHVPLSLFLSRYIGIYGVIASMCFINLFYAVIFTIQIRKQINQTASGIWAR